MRRQRLQGALRGAVGLLIVLVVLLARPRVSGADQEPVRANASAVEAAFLRNFAHYMTWPASAFASESAPWRIGVLGADPFGTVLEKTFQGRTEQGRSFQMFRAETLSELPPCQIIFVGYPDAARRRAALAVLKTRPVLTVGEAPAFLEEGGIIRFQVSDRVELSVNLDQARASSLKIQTKVLEIAREVVENGVTRRRR